MNAQNTTVPLHHQRRGRSLAALLTLAAVFGGLLLLVAVIDLNLWIAGVLALFALPAAWEALTDPLSTFELTAHNMSWSTPTVNDELATNLILRARFDTRLDLSVKVTLFLKDGRKLRLPYACTPPHEALEAALKDLGIATERHHFSLIG
ncbi:hypothetical protein KO498_13445 [Lentibacter algarum]|uniref:hypothetical protein n=1 Tax=Lentibacter algarum TaxID=576131 RepID=UPI001C0A2EDB|nr:hypothetical protein [Lentibacter algarum]MBU2982816.1 hypothetical protein [Lentibacter algarum]